MTDITHGHKSLLLLRMGTWIARLHYRMYNRGLGVIIPAGIRIPSLYQSIHKGPTGHRTRSYSGGLRGRPVNLSLANI